MAAARLLSDNFYWLAADSASYRQLNRLPAASVVATKWLRQFDGGSDHNVVRLPGESRQNCGASRQAYACWIPATGARILPAYYSDNYISLLPGESVKSAS